MGDSRNGQYPCSSIHPLNEAHKWAGGSAEDEKGIVGITSNALDAERESPDVGLLIGTIQWSTKTQLHDSLIVDI